MEGWNGGTGGWRDIRMEEWRDGGMGTEGWNGRMEGWRDGGLPQSLLFGLAEGKVSLDHLPDVFGLFVCQTRQIQFSIHDAEIKEG